MVWHKAWRPVVLLSAVVVHGGIALVLGMMTFGLAMLIGNMAFLSPQFVRAVIASADPPMVPEIGSSAIVGGTLPKSEPPLFAHAPASRRTDDAASAAGDAAQRCQQRPAEPKCNG